MTQDWLAALIFLIPAALFAGFVIYCIWSGKFPTRGHIIFRAESSGTFWTGVGFFAVCALALAAEAIFPDWGARLLEHIGIFRR